jgi:hypothetical protein
VLLLLIQAELINMVAILVEPIVRDGVYLMANIIVTNQKAYLSPREK